MCKNRKIEAGMYIKPVKDVPGCMCADKEYLVLSDADDDIYIECDVGRHYLVFLNEGDMSYYEEVTAR